MSPLDDSYIPGAVYHYTDLKGLIGILTEKSIWATNISYLNDFGEYKYAFEQYKGVVDLLVSSTAGTSKEISLARVKERLANLPKRNICICCFSETLDVLSQWRSYGADGTGFAVGFAGVDLHQLGKRQGFTLNRCEYEPNEHRLLVAEMLDYFQKGFYTTGAQGCLNEFEWIACRIKNPDFSEEKEWRLVSRPLDVKQMEVRAGRSTPVPYFKFSLARRDELPLHIEIVMGPNTQYPDLTLRAIETLCAKVDVIPNITQSTIPYRGRL
jgi:hypothetical protein